MKLSTLKINNVSKKIEKVLENKQNSKSLLCRDNINSIGIIVNEGSNFNFEMLKELQRQVELKSENFNVLTCKKESNENYNEFRGVSFYEKQFNWSGVLKSKQVNEFLDKSFDMLIDYTNVDTVYKKYLIAKSKAKFKVGLANVDDRLYDFMIVVKNENIEIFNKELVKYLKIFRKLD